MNFPEKVYRVVSNHPVQARNFAKQMYTVSYSVTIEPTKGMKIQSSDHEFRLEPYIDHALGLSNVSKSMPSSVESRGGGGSKIGSLSTQQTPNKAKNKSKTVVEALSSQTKDDSEKRNTANDTVSKQASPLNTQAKLTGSQISISSGDSTDKLMCSIDVREKTNFNNKL